MPSGRPPDLKRRQQIFRLRAAGLSLTQIGEKLGVSRQRVQTVLKLTGDAPLVPVRCRECESEIARRRIANRNAPVWCLACLAKHPKATFGQRLKTYRLAAGLTLTGLEARCGIRRNLISGYECDRSEPKWRSLAKLIRVQHTMTSQSLGGWP